MTENDGKSTHLTGIGYEMVTLQIYRPTWSEGQLSPKTVMSSLWRNYLIRIVTVHGGRRMNGHNLGEAVTGAEGRNGYEQWAPNC